MATSNSKGFLARVTWGERGDKPRPSPDADPTTSNTKGFFARVTWGEPRDKRRPTPTSSSDASDPAAPPKQSRLKSILKRRSSPRPPPRTPSPAPRWKHHDYYYPPYVPLVPPSTAPEPVGVTGNGPRGDAYSQALAEAAAAAHARQVGHPVAIHYPSLPKFGDYPAAKNWQRSTWGNVGQWSGYGWAGEKLPDKEGRVFGNPMPEGKIEGKGSGGGGKANKGKKGEA